MHIEFALKKPLITKRGAWAPPAKRVRGGFIRQCCYCRKIQIEGGAWELRLHDIHHVTHGICPDCMSKQITALNNHIAERKVVAV